MTSNRQILTDMLSTSTAMHREYAGEWWPVDPTDPASAVTNGRVTMSPRAFTQLFEQPGEILPAGKRIEMLASMVR